METKADYFLRFHHVYDVYSNENIGEWIQEIIQRLFSFASKIIIKELQKLSRILNITNFNN